MRICIDVSMEGLDGHPRIYTDVFPCIQDREYKEPRLIMEVKHLGNIYGDNFGTGYARNVMDTNYLCQTLTGMQGGGRQPMIIIDDTQGFEDEARIYRDVSPTIRSQRSGLKVMEETEKRKIESQYRIRKITPKEGWRLMEFTDEDFHKAEAVNSNTQLYKQAGNSIVRNVLVAIFGQMIPGKENVYKEV